MFEASESAPAGYSIRRLMEYKVGEDQTISEDDIANIAQIRFARCRNYVAEADQERLRFAIQVAGSQWGKTATADEIIAAIEGAGFQITRAKTL